MTAFDFRTFLDVAQELSTRDDQAYYRSALSRAYYAVFGTAWRALPPSLQTHIGQGRVHRETWSQYNNASSQISRRIGGIGLRLRDLRHEADYDPSVIFTATRVRHALNEARLALSMLDRHGYQP